MNREETIVNKVTRSKLRGSLYHVTRMSNLQSMASADALFAAGLIEPLLSFQCRSAMKQVYYNNHSITLNAHLQIPNSVMDPLITQLEFFAFIDQHVFLCPTKQEARKFLGNYSRREPDESFAVLKFNANTLLKANFNAVKLSKYDSGSAPRFPNRCKYKKCIAMFLPLQQFGSVHDSLVPDKPSDIHEVLVTGEVPKLTRHIEAVYCEQVERVPDRWKPYWRPLQDLSLPPEGK